MTIKLSTKIKDYISSCFLHYSIIFLIKGFSLYKFACGCVFETMLPLSKLCMGYENL